MQSVECILLAAGFGERFGGDKLLAELATGNSVLAETVSVYQRVFDTISIVCRPEQIEIFDSVISSTAGLNFISNANAKQGMSQSLLAGINSVECDKGWLIALADMPFVRAETVKTIVQKTKEADVVRPVYNAQPGNPVYISKVYSNDLQKIDGDCGARSLIMQLDHNDVLNFAVDDPGVCWDIDTVDDIPA